MSMSWMKSDKLIYCLDPGHGCIIDEPHSKSIHHVTMEKMALGVDIQEILFYFRYIYDTVRSYYSAGSYIINAKLHTL